MKAVPRRLVVLGGGPAGVELAQAVRRLGGEVALVEGAEHVLCPRARAARRGARRGPAPRRHRARPSASTRRAARRDGEDYVLELDDGRELRGDRLLVATGRRPRVEGIGLETVGVEADPHGIPVDARMRAGERLWAIGDVTGIWPLTHVGEYQGDVVAANILGEPAEANYEAVPRVTYTDPQAAAVGADEAAFSGTAPLAEVAKTATYTHAYAESNGFLTLLSDGERLTGAYALGPEAGEWLQQATLAIRARVPLDVLRDTIQPFPSFSEIHAAALKALRRRSRRPPTEGPRRRRWQHTPTGRALDGQTVVVIGGSAGIGLETARRARAEGADVVLTGRNPERLERAARELGARSTAAFDATDFAALERFFDDLPDAGRPRDGHRRRPALRAAAGHGPRRGARGVERAPPAAAARRPPRRRQGAARGHAALHRRHRRPPPGVGLGLVSAITAAMPALIASLALELAPVRVNLIAAGFVDTPLSASLLGDGLDARREQLRATLPIGRVVGPDDVAALAVHLMTNTALTGATYDIDGGQQFVPRPAG